MEVVETLLASGRIVDLMLGVLVAEFLIVTALYQRNRGGVPALPLLVNIGAGASLMLALRAALTASGTAWTVTWLVSALLFHVCDLVLRWQPPVRD